MVSVKKILAFQWVILLIIIFGIGFIGVQVYAINNKLNSQSTFIGTIEEVSKSTYILLATPIPESTTGTADIYVDEEGMAWSKGTAFVVTEDGWLLTAFHTLENSRGAAILEFDDTGKEILTHVKEVIADSNNDFALIKVDKTLTPVNLFEGFYPVKAGTEIGFMGFPKGETSLFTHDGIISRVYDKDGEPRYNLHSFVNQGQSGGPVFMPENGKVIGFISARLKASDLPRRELVDPSVSDDQLMQILLDLKRGQDEIYNILSEELGRSSQMGIGVVIAINNAAVNRIIAGYNEDKN